MTRCALLLATYLFFLPPHQVHAAISANLSVQITPAPTGTYPLKIANGQLQTASGAPFVLIGNNGYAAMAVVPPTGNGGANMTNYFSNLRAQGFNASLEFGFQVDDNIRNGIAYDGTAAFTSFLSGCTPSGQGVCFDLTTPNAAYWSQVVNMVNLAAQYGININLGTIDGGGCAAISGGQLLANNGSTRTRTFGVFLGNTFKNIPNITWYHGDDFSCFNNHTYDDPMFAMAQGIQSTGDTHLQTIELCGPLVGYCSASSQATGYSFPTSLDDTTNNWASVVGINWIYQYGTTFQQALHAYNQSPSTPAVIGEIDWAGGDNTQANTGSYSGCQNDAQIATAPYCPIRQRAEEWYIATFGGYWGGFVGRGPAAPGPLFSYAYPSPIPVVPDTQFVYLANFMRSIPWYKLQPSPGGSGSILTAGFGSNAGGTTLGSNYVTSSLAADGSVAVAYLPQGGTVTVNMALMATGVTAKWYDPTADPTQTSSYTTICSPTGTVCGTGSQVVTSPLTHSDGTADAVLLLQASSPSAGVACDIGPPYTGPIPTGAQAAGYTHCAINYDFTSTTNFTCASGTPCAGHTYNFSQVNTWLDCAITNGNPPLWFNYGYYPYNHPPYNPPCGQYVIGTDVAGGISTNVLIETYSVGMACATGVCQEATQMVMNMTLPNGHYVDLLERYDTATVNVTGLNSTDHGGLFGNNISSNGNYVEWDITDGGGANPSWVYPTVGGCIDWSTNPLGYHCGGGVTFPPGWSMTNYNTYGMLIESDGTTYLGGCSYINNLLANPCAVFSAAAVRRAGPEGSSCP